MGEWIAVAKIKDKLKKIWVSKAFTVTLFVALLIFLVFWVFHLLDFSYNHVGSYDQTVRTQKGETDFSDIDLKTADDHIRISGEWNFYYNKWIITDEIEGKSDGLIYVPSRWTGKSFGDSTLTKDGFASYSMTLKNVAGGQNIAVRVSMCDTPYRIFANGTLITSYGVMSKNKSQTLIAYDVEQLNTYTTQSQEDVEIVIEIGNANLGGLNDGVLVLMQGQGAKTAFYHFIDNSHLFFAGIVLSLTIINLLMVFSLFGKKKEWTSITFLLAVFSHYIFSKGMFFVLLRYFGVVPPALFYVLNMLSGCFMLIAFLRHLQHEGIVVFSKKLHVLLIGIIAVLYLVYYFMTGTVWQMIPFFLLLMLMAYILYPMLRSMRKGVRFSFIYTVFMMFSMVVFIYEGMDFWSSIVFSSSLPVTMLVTASSIIMSIVYFIRMRQNTVEAMQGIQLQKEYTEMRHASMLAQIKPHFVFNSLTSIQSLYHESLDEGDAALTYFSKHLRANIESDTRELIPFEDEILNINNYFMLENMRLKDKLTLLFDIDYVDFSVPILSLQPLIENAIKYAKTDSKKDGYIQILSRLKGNYIAVIIKDNGVGFDVSKMNSSSKGLENITERFKYCLNAEIQVVSKIGEGTTVSILIPYKRETDKA